MTVFMIFKSFLHSLSLSHGRKECDRAISVNNGKTA